MVLLTKYFFAERIGAGGFASGTSARSHDQLGNPVGHPHDPIDQRSRHTGWTKHGAQGYCRTHDLPY